MTEIPLTEAQLERVLHAVLEMKRDLRKGPTPRYRMNDLWTESAQEWEVRRTSFYRTKERFLAYAMRFLPPGFIESQDSGFVQ